MYIYIYVYIYICIHSYTYIYINICWHSNWHSIWYSIWHTAWHLFWHSFWHFVYNILPNILCDISSNILSDFMWHLAHAIEVLQFPLRSGTRGWGPAVPAEICGQHAALIKSRDPHLAGRNIPGRFTKSFIFPWDHKHHRQQTMAVLHLVSLQ